MLVRDQDSWKLFGKRKQSKLLLERSITRKDGEDPKCPISKKCLTRRARCAIFQRDFPSSGQRGNTTIKLQLQVDLAFYQEIRLHVRGHEAESVSVCPIDW